MHADRLHLVCRAFREALDCEERWRLFLVKSSRLAFEDTFESWQGVAIPGVSLRRQPQPTSACWKFPDAPVDGIGIVRRDANQLSQKDFTSLFDEPGIPVVLEGIYCGTRGEAGEAWSDAWLSEACGSRDLNVNGVRILPTVQIGASMPLSSFLRYRDAAVLEANPLGSAPL